MAESEAPAKAIQVKLVLLGEAAVGKSSLVLRFVQNDFNENNSPTIGAAFLTQKCRLEDKVIKFEIWDTAGQERFHSLAPMYYRNAAAAVVVYDITKASSLEKAKAWVTELQRQANPNIVIALVGNKLDLITDGPSNTTTAATPTSPFSSTQPDPSATETPLDPTSTTPAADESAVDGVAAEETEIEDEDASKSAAGAGAEAESQNPRQVAKEDAKAYAVEAGDLLFFEASAKTGLGVQEIFTEIAKNLPVESIQPKTPAQAGAANSRRAAGATGPNDGNKVKLGENAPKAKGGCC